MERINRIKEVLAAQGIKQKELAERVGVHPNTIAKICNNVSQPRLGLLVKIAQALDVDVRELLVGTKPNTFLVQR